MIQTAWRRDALGQLEEGVRWIDLVEILRGDTENDPSLEPDENVFLEGRSESIFGAFSRQDNCVDLGANKKNGAVPSGWLRAAGQEADGIH